MGYRHPVPSVIDDYHSPPQVGDVLKVSVKGGYVTPVVFRVCSYDKPGSVIVYASRRGLGSFKCEWVTSMSRGHDAQGRKYYLHRRA